MKKPIAIAVLCAALCTSATRAWAQQRPLLTEDPETVGTGNVLIEAGFDAQRDIFYPASGLTGDLLRVPMVGLSIGFSSILELQLDAGFYDHLDIDSIVPAPLSDQLEIHGDTTTDVDDVIVATKIRVVSEGPGRPSFGIRLATKLPIMTNASGLGLDTMDFHVVGLIGKTTRAVRLVGNFGLGILSDPVEGDRQNDVILYGLSVARALPHGVEFVGEVNGRLNTRDQRTPVGTESRSTLRVGGRWTKSAVRVDGGLIFGLTSRDPSFGFTAGLTYVFHGFTLP
jgi:hypothetical protein